MRIVNINADESGDLAVTPADQPDGIADDTTDLPDPKRAARRVRAYIERCGDGLYDVVDRRPLYARDVYALTKAADKLAELSAENERLTKKVAVLEKRTAYYRDRISAAESVSSATLAADRQIEAHVARGDSPSVIFYAGAALAIAEVRARLAGEQS